MQSKSGSTSNQVDNGGSVALTLQYVAPVESRGRFSESRALLVGFPEETRRLLEAELRQWMMQSSSAENIQVAAARMSEATSLGRPYRLALVYVEDDATDMTAVAEELRAGDGISLSLILCAPRQSLAAWTARLPPQFSSAIGFPYEKSLLYNALHGVLAGEELAAGAISLADYYRLHKAQGKPYYILVVDDAEINRKIIAKQLEMAGHSVKAVADGEQALDALDETRLHFDVIIIDSNMPVMDGFHATRVIRLMEDRRAITPIIMISADATPHAIDEAKAAGVDMFLPKPIDASALFAAIERLCEKRFQDVAGVVQIRA
jgi:two-component system sensor histidine kinase RpfC